MIMTMIGLAQIAIVHVAVILAFVPLGVYIARVLAGERTLLSPALKPMESAGGVRVGEFVDDDEPRFARQGRVDVKLLDNTASIGDLSPLEDFESFGQRLGFLAAMRLDKADDDVLTFGLGRPGAREHRIGLAHAGRGAEENAQRSFSSTSRANYRPR